MSTMLADPRTEQVQAAAEEVDHIFCDNCHPMGVVFCGAQGEELGGPCPNGYECTEHPECPICRMLDDEHECPEVP